MRGASFRSLFLLFSANSRVIQDSLLATPLIIDLVILTELLTRVKYRSLSVPGQEFAPLYPVLSLLSYMLKAPLVKPGTPCRSINESRLMLSQIGSEVVNSLNRQRNALEGFLKACIGIEGNSDLLLESRIW
jgi:myo-inositol-1-phosphate synthase